MSDAAVTSTYRAARDSLLALRGRPEDAVGSFHWPDLGHRFNWAVDWFDAVARGNDGLALVVVEEDGTSESVSFDAMAARSDRVAKWLAEQGIRRGDPVIIMLNNQVELWDVMLAVMKLGAVIMPTTTAAGPADLTDRITRGGALHVVANAADAPTFDSVPGT
ncbi:MAG: AMP-binding protein, partial [Nostocoides sp.]